MAGAATGGNDWRRSEPTLLRRFELLPVLTCRGFVEGGVGGTRFSLPTRGIIEARPVGGLTFEYPPLLARSTDGRRLPLSAPTLLTLTGPRVWRRWFEERLIVDIDDDASVECFDRQHRSTSSYSYALGVTTTENDDDLSRDDGKKNTVAIKLF